jgi:hypothetical protein
VVHDLDNMKRGIETLRKQAVELHEAQKVIETNIERCSNDIRILEGNMSDGRALNVCTWVVFISHEFVL